MISNKIRYINLFSDNKCTNKAGNYEIYKHLQFILTKNFDLKIY